MNKKITVELDWDTIDMVTTCSMKGLVENLEVEQIDETNNETVDNALERLHLYDYEGALRMLKNHPTYKEVKKHIEASYPHWDKLSDAENNDERTKHEDSAHEHHDRAVAVLKSVRRKMKEEVQEIEKRKAGTGMAIFHENKKKDIAEIKRHIDAFRTVLKYYGEGNA